MSGQQDVRDAIVNASTDAGSRVYTGDAGNQPTAPYVMISRSGGVPSVRFRGTGLTQYLYQTDVFAETLLQAQAIDAAVQTAMKGASFKGIPLNVGLDGYEDVVQLHRVTSSYHVWQ